MRKQRHRLARIDPELSSARFSSKAAAVKPDSIRAAPEQLAQLSPVLPTGAGSLRGDRMPGAGRTARPLWPGAVTRVREPLTSSMRTPGGEVVGGRWGRSVIDRRPSRPFAVDGVAVFECCTASTSVGEGFQWESQARFKHSCVLI